MPSYGLTVKKTSTARDCCCTCVIDRNFPIKTVALVVGVAAGILAFIVVKSLVIAALVTVGSGGLTYLILRYLQDDDGSGSSSHKRGKNLNNQNTSPLRSPPRSRSGSDSLRERETPGAPASTVVIELRTSSNNNTPPPTRPNATTFNTAPQPSRASRSLRSEIQGAAPREAVGQRDAAGKNTLRSSGAGSPSLSTPPPANQRQATSKRDADGKNNLSSLNSGSPGRRVSDSDVKRQAAGQHSPDGLNSLAQNASPGGINTDPITAPSKYLVPPTLPAPHGLESSDVLGYRRPDKGGSRGPSLLDGFNYGDPFAMAPPVLPPGVWQAPASSSPFGPFPSYPTHPDYLDAPIPSRHTGGQRLEPEHPSFHASLSTGDPVGAAHLVPPHARTSSLQPASDLITRRATERRAQSSAQAGQPNSLLVPPPVVPPPQRQAASGGHGRPSAASSVPGTARPALPVSAPSASAPSAAPQRQAASGNHERPSAASPLPVAARPALPVSAPPASAPSAAPQRQAARGQPAHQGPASPAQDPNAPVRQAARGGRKQTEV